MDLKHLNERYGLDGQLEFVEGPGGLVQASITTKDAAAVIATYGAQVLSYKPVGADEDVFFLSKKAHYAPGKATKGGVPVCWPWFGPDPEGLGRPGHGLVRNRQWEVRNAALLGDGSVELVLGLSDTEDTRDVWPQAFELEMRVSVGKALDITLTTRNRGETPFTISQGLHSYFKVGDISEVAVKGLANCLYIDKMDDSRLKSQQGLVTITGETDRIYTGVSKDMVIADKALGRAINIAAQGSASAVVWNPWVDTAKSMGDLGDDDYKQLICVETTNAAADEVDIAPGMAHSLTCRIELSTL